MPHENGCCYSRARVNEGGKDHGKKYYESH